eukprot:CAMPEP_0196577522 /NCGR_PEP_ID=MMETSP1081-20130531/6581_1 /TAXON_ID=36882 /ORGANISM="Pyramimonas amylifera, Strain CCMP720" /LENGTH=73 /DNA_ID=CAMNT_0041896473 /DNA_START=110 /DNA_END=328 /DNA_ORIENTATION=-
MSCHWISKKGTGWWMKCGCWGGGETCPNRKPRLRKLVKTLVGLLENVFRAEACQRESARGAIGLFTRAHGSGL